jgi:CRP/FNR family transcriptional regulator
MKQDILNAACSKCSLSETCMPEGFSSDGMHKLSAIVAIRRRIRLGQSLFKDGDPFASLYVIRSGFFKTSLIESDGREQILGFQMAGELIGLDGIVNESHSCNATALEDSEVCAIPYTDLEKLSKEHSALQHHMHQVMSHEIVRKHGVLMLLGNMKGEERLATFLLNLAQRQHVRGFSQSELQLRMSREEIGMYLGLELATISRLFSQLSSVGSIEVKNRYVKILNPAHLKSIGDKHPHL